MLISGDSTISEHESVLHLISFPQLSSHSSQRVHRVVIARSTETRQAAE